MSELKKLSDKIYYLPYTEPTDRPSLFYLKGERLSLMIDAGNSPKHVELFNKTLEDAGFRKPDLCVVTHWHWDHTLGICALDIPVISGAATDVQLKAVSDCDWSQPGFRYRDECLEREYDEDLSTVKVQRANIVFSNTLSLDLGGLKCTLVEIGGPHSLDSVVIYAHEEKVLFAGDSSSGDYYELNWGYDKKRLQRYITALEGIPFETFAHSHLEPVSREEIFAKLKQQL